MPEQYPLSPCRSFFSLGSVLLVLAVGLVPGASCTGAGGDPGAEPIPEAKDQDIGSLGVAGYAKLLCSSVFVSEMEDGVAIEHSRRVTRALVRLPAEDMAQVTESIDHENRLVRATLRGTLTRTARLYGDQGCIIHPEDHDGIYFDPVAVRTSLPDGETLPWPMGDLLPDEPLPPEVDEEKLKAAVEVAFEPPSRTAGLVVVYKGRLVAERYAEGITKDTLMESWSQGKSLTGTLIGRLEQEGLLKLQDPAPVPEWQGPGDERSKITIADLMRMSSGLEFTLYERLVKSPEGRLEVGPQYPDHYYPYVGAIDVFRYVVSRPLQFPPNTVGRYRNCDPLTLGYIVTRIVQGQR
ncbi:MAG: serine hydrolase, partial [Candidatus Aminicenantes bacterium]|nr:serine hydrolase [Candidatus Aminicenantes bacterium]